MPKTEELLEELQGLAKLVEDMKSPPKPTPVVVEQVSTDLESAARRIKEMLSAVEEILVSAEETAPFRRFVWLGWGAVQSLVSSLDGAVEEIQRHGKAFEKDVTGAVQVVEDLKRLLAPVREALDRLSSISKVK